jgi:heme exporter protein C
MITTPALRRISWVLGAGTVVASIAAVVQGLFVQGPTIEQHDFSRLLVVHPPLAVVTFLAFGVTALASALYLIPRTRRREWDQLAGASAEVGVVLCFLTLVTGSIWGRPTWGVWWTWDARITTEALLGALFLGYLALRRVPAEVTVRSRRCAIAGLVAALDIPIVHYATTWWQTLHQANFPLLRPDKTLDGPQLLGMGLGFLAMTLLYCWLVMKRFAVEQLEERLDVEGLQFALDERRAEAGPPAPMADPVVASRGVR